MKKPPKGLRHTWGVPANEDLQAAHRNHREFWCHLARVTDGAVVEVPGGLIVDTGIRAAGFNQLQCGAGGTQDTAAVAAVAAHFQERDLMWRVVSERPSAAVQELATLRGIEREPLYPIMTMAVGNAAQPRETPLEQSTAADLADLRAFVDCAAAGYRMDSALLKPIVHKRALSDDDFWFCLGRLDGRCVAVSIGVRSGDTVGVYFVAVRRGFRHRGFGAAIAQQAIQAGFAAGARLAVLQATSSGYPLYVDMGFTHVADYYMWDFPIYPRKPSAVNFE